MSDWVKGRAPAKLNLALVVGPTRVDGRHEVVTILQRLTLADVVAVRPARTVRVDGFREDTLVRGALESLSQTAPGAPTFQARIEKHVPVASGLGGGSSDAATALVLANGLLDEPLSEDALHELAVGLGADVPFFLRPGDQLGTGDGTTLRALSLPTDYTVLLALPDGAEKTSTGEVYAAFDERGGAAGFDDRRIALHRALVGLRTSADLAALPPNDLASSPVADELRGGGSLRADVSGAGPIVYGLFEDERDAARIAHSLAGRATTWLAQPG